MFNVANRKVIHRLSSRLLNANRTRNIIAVIAIILTTVLFTTVFTVGMSVVESFQLSTMRQVGTRSHGGFKFLTEQQYDKVKADTKVKDISFNIIIGFAENAKLNKTHTEIRYTEEKAVKWSFSNPTTGTLPQKRLDIATSAAVLDALGLPHELGVSVPLEFTANGKKYKESFTLCGYWEQDVVMGANQAFLSKEYCDEVAPAWQDGEDVSFDRKNYSGSINPSLFFSSSWDIDTQMQNLKARCGFSDDVNDGVNWAYTTSTVDAGTIFLIIALLFLIMLSGYLIIYNIFYISVNGEIRFYGLLKTIGTTNRQLKRLVRRQALLLCIVGIPVGLLIGYLISVFLIPIVISTTAIGSDYMISINPVVFLGSMIFSFMTVMISCIKPCRFVCKISPIDAVRYTDNTDKQHNKNKKARHVTPLAMAFGNIGRTKKKTIAVVLSLSLSLILLNGTISLVKGFDMDKYIENNVVSDFYVTDASITNLNSSYNTYNGISGDIQKDISMLDGITEIGSVYMREYNHVLSEKAYKNSQKILEDYRSLIFSKPEYATEIERKLKEEHSMYSHIYGADEFVAKKMELFSGKLDMEKFKSGDYIVVSTMSTDGDGHFYEIGDTVTIDYGNGNKKDYKVMALGDIPYALSPQHGHLFDVYFTMYSDEFIAQTGETGALKTAFDVREDCYDKTESWVKNYCKNTEVDYRSKQTYIDQFKNIQNMYLLVGSALSFIFALIGILNFINAMITSIQARKRELAILQSIGMTGKQLEKMLIGEGMLYIALTGIFTVSAGSFITYGIVSAISNQMWFFTYHFIIIPLLLGLCVFAVIASIIPVICYKNICKKSIVDRLRVSE